MDTADRRQHRQQSRSCAYCGTTGDQCRLKLCSGCSLVRYCSTEHQRAHWPEHKASCSPARPSSSSIDCGAKNIESSSTSRIESRQSGPTAIHGSCPAADSKASIQTSEAKDTVCGSGSDLLSHLDPRDNPGSVLGSNTRYTLARTGAATPGVAHADRTVGPGLAACFANAAGAAGPSERPTPSAAPQTLGWMDFTYPHRPPPAGAVLMVQLVTDPSAPLPQSEVQFWDVPHWAAFALDKYGELGMVVFQLRCIRFERSPLSSLRAGAVLRWSRPRVFVGLDGDFEAMIEDEDLLNILVMHELRSTGSAPRRRAAATRATGERTRGSSVQGKSTFRKEDNRGTVRRTAAPVRQVPPARQERSVRQPFLSRLMSGEVLERLVPAGLLLLGAIVMLYVLFIYKLVDPRSNPPSTRYAYRG